LRPCQAIMAVFAVFSRRRGVVDAEVEALVDRIVAGDETAWPLLWRRVESKLLATLRRPYFIGSLSQREDDCRNIVVEVMARLRANDYARLRTYAETRRRKPDIVFMAWLLVVAKRVAIDYMRAHEDYEDRRRQRDASTPGKWRVLETLVADSKAPGARPSITNDATVHEILETARTLPAPQLAALTAWLAGHDYAEIAMAQSLPSAKDAERAVRAALASLRRRVREEDPS